MKVRLDIALIPALTDGEFTLGIKKHNKLHKRGGATVEYQR